MIKKTVFSLLIVALLIAFFSGLEISNAKGNNEFNDTLKAQEQLNSKGQKAFENILALKGIKLSRNSRSYIVELIAFVSDPSFKPLANKENTAIDFYATTILNQLTQKEEESILKEVMERNPNINEESKITENNSFTYYRDYAVSYAQAHVHNYNPQYQNFNYPNGGGDCTNFVSQCLYAGGVPMVNTIWPRTSSYDWYYYFNRPGYEDDEFSHPWINATSLYRHFSWGRPGLAVLVDYDYQLQLGDVVQLSSDSSSEPYHSMIVTAIGDNGEVFVSYHTTDTWNKSLWALEIEYGNDKFSRWHITH